MSSPRPWGCFCSHSWNCCLAEVFPTPVGVFLRYLYVYLYRSCLPHARGGVSFILLIRTQERRSSPRPWGCFYCRLRIAHFAQVFPTPVGVFPNITSTTVCRRSLPHARGGVSLPQQIYEARHKSSPRPWGCFQLRYQRCLMLVVFPTPVGVFPY